MIDMYKYTDKEIKELLKSIIILVDSRENANSHILKWFDEKKISYKIEKLEFCDYSFLLPANSELGFNRDLYFADKISIERKGSLEEISGNFTTDRLRFESEFIRSKGKVHLLIENASYEDIITHNYKTEYNPSAFIGGLHSFADRYNFSINFIKDNKYSAQFIYYTFYYFCRNYLMNK